MLPHYLSSQVVLRNAQGDILLMLRQREAGPDRWALPGGKLESARGESPYACALREIEEETGVSLEASRLHLYCLLHEPDYKECAWTIFIFDYTGSFDRLPDPSSEGRFDFFNLDAIRRLPMIELDRRLLLRESEFSGASFVAVEMAPDGSWSVQEVRQP